MKGCASFALIFLLGIGLIASGIVYDVTVAANIERQAYPARVLEVSGIVVAFAAIYGAVGWAFLKRVRAQRSEANGTSDKTH